jgi:hypothetical protein
VLDYEVGVRIVVEFTTRGREVIDYAVVLTVDDEPGEAVTVCVYDSAHGVNEMHRHDRAGEKAPAASFHAGTRVEGRRAALVAVRAGYATPSTPRSWTPTSRWARDHPRSRRGLRSRARLRGRARAHHHRQTLAASR